MNCRHGFDLNGGKHGIDKVPPRKDHLFLQAFVPASVNECLRILKRVVAFDFRPGNLTGVQRLAVLDRNDANGIDGDLQHLG